jgi:hypothetical protein
MVYCIEDGANGIRRLVRFIVPYGAQLATPLPATVDCTLAGVQTLFPATLLTADREFVTSQFIDITVLHFSPLSADFANPKASPAGLRVEIAAIPDPTNLSNRTFIVRPDTSSLLNRQVVVRSVALRAEQITRNR